MRDILTQAIDELNSYRQTAASRIDVSDRAFVITQGYSADGRNFRVFGSLYLDEINPRTPEILEGFRVQRIMNTDGVRRYRSSEVDGEAQRLKGLPILYRAWLQSEVNAIDGDLNRLSQLRTRFPALTPKVEVFVNGDAVQLADGARIDSIDEDTRFDDDPEKNPE